MFVNLSECRGGTIHLNAMSDVCKKSQCDLLCVKSACIFKAASKWANAGTHLTGESLPHKQIQYTCTQDLSAMGAEAFYKCLILWFSWVFWQQLLKSWLPLTHLWTHKNTQPPTNIHRWRHTNSHKYTSMRGPTHSHCIWIHSYTYTNQQLYSLHTEFSGNRQLQTQTSFLRIFITYLSAYRLSWNIARLVGDWLATLVGRAQSVFTD